MDFTTFRFQSFSNEVPSYWSEELSCLFEKIKQVPPTTRELLRTK